MCKKPITLKDQQKVKCGRCIECLMARSYEWATRLDIEAKHAKSGVFLTLTYDDEHAIWIDSPETGETLTTLHRPDIQKFFMKLRVYQKRSGNKDQVRTFYCGEYGGKTKRAHYHALVFNLDKSVIKRLEKNEIWNKGFIVVGDVTSKSIRYVSNYMLLKDVDIVRGQKKPFTGMSLKPAIGYQYTESTRNFEHHMIHEKDEMLVPGKKKPNINNYMLHKITDPITAKRIKDKRLENWNKIREERLKELEKTAPLDPLGQLEKEKDQKVKEKQRKFKAYKKTNTL